MPRVFGKTQNLKTYCVTFVTSSPYEGKYVIVKANGIWDAQYAIAKRYGRESIAHIMSKDKFDREGYVRRYGFALMGTIIADEVCG